MTRKYFVQNKWLVLYGFLSGIALAAMVLHWPFGFLSGPFALFLLGFPFIAKTQVERLRRYVLLGFCISLASVFIGKTSLPFAWIGFVGSSLFGAVTFCLRYQPPSAEHS